MKRRLAAAVVAGSVAALAAAPLGTADPIDRDLRVSKKLRQAVTLEGVYRHTRQFDRIGRANGNTRLAGTNGYASSARYVMNVLRRAGYTPTTQSVPFEFYRYLSSSFGLTAPTPRTFTFGTDYSVLEYSASGNVTGTIQAVDLNLTGDRASTSGCEAADFAGFTAGNVALIQRGTCTFEDKAENAKAAGAVGVIVMNQGNTPEREVLLQDVTLGATYTGGIPVVGVSFALGQELSALAGAAANIVARTESGQRTAVNVIAETRWGRANNVVMLGAHLDSVAEGPGVNDNGSGSAALLEIAVQLSKRKVTRKAQLNNKVRFAWWTAEESGLIGSEYYIANLPEAQRRNIALYLNFDMIASPNFMRGIYDADVEGSAVAPPGSDEIEQVFRDYFESQGLAHKGTDFSGRSDYGPFIAEGVDIPAGGLFTGAEEVKPAEEVALFGGTAGEAYDRCYHQACDTLANVNRQALNEMSDAIAHATMVFARNTFLVNGVGMNEGDEDDDEDEPRRRKSLGVHDHQHTLAAR